MKPEKTTQRWLPLKRVNSFTRMRTDLRRLVGRFFPEAPMPAPLERGPRATPTNIQRFMVLDVVSTSAMGTVFRAFDPQLQRVVAIKVLAHPLRAVAEEPSRVETVDLHAAMRDPDVELLSESRRMARLSHPNVLPIYEVGLADQSLFVVMEHVEGCDLRTWLQTRRPLHEIMHVLAQAGSGLAAAHACTVVHRDFKPESVLFGNDGRVCVADFSLSQWLSAERLAPAEITGAPGYIAPELLLGHSATTASDVYSFAVVCAEALGVEPGATSEERDRKLRERGAALQLRAAIGAGLADDPATRCSLDTLVAALDGQRRRPRRWPVAAGSIAILIAAIANGASTPVALAPPECNSTDWHASTWTQLRRAQVMTQLVRDGRSFDSAQRVTTLLDRNNTAITRAFEGTCSAVQANALTRAQAGSQRSCLEQRRLELTTVVDHLLTMRHDFETAHGHALALVEPDRCAELIQPPSSTNPALLAMLYARMGALDDSPSKHGDAEHAALEQLAERNGERFLAARIALARGVLLITRDKLIDGEQVVQRAYRMAIELNANELAAGALLQHSRVALLRGDGMSGRNYAQLARALIDRPNTSRRSRARVYLGLARVDNERGDIEAEIERIRTAMELLDKNGEDVDIEISLRLQYCTAMNNARAPQALDVARETVRRIKQLVGDHDRAYSRALSELAHALRRNGQRDEAVQIRRDALAVVSDIEPAEDSYVMALQLDLATDLLVLGKFEQARQLYATVLEAAKHNEGFAGDRPDALGLYAVATFNVGRFAEAMRLQDEAYSEALANYGPDHPWTINMLSARIENALELKAIAPAQGALDRLHAVYRSHPELALEAANAHGSLDTDLLLLRGKPRAAERVAREALVRMHELHASDAQLQWGYFALEESLRLQRRYSAARVAIETSREYAIKANARADELAYIDVKTAELDFAQGHRAEAFRRAKQARSLLERFPGRPRARADADALLARFRRS